MILLQSNNLSPFEYISQHLQLIGWPALVIIAWKAGNLFQTFVNTLEKTIGQIDKMATNHFPHMEESLAKQDGLLLGMSESLKAIVRNTSGRH